MYPAYLGRSNRYTLGGIQHWISTPMRYLLSQFSHSHRLQIPQLGCHQPTFPINKAILGSLAFSSQSSSEIQTALFKKIHQASNRDDMASIILGLAQDVSSYSEERLDLIVNSIVRLTDKIQRNEGILLLAKQARLLTNDLRKKLKVEIAREPLFHQLFLNTAFESGTL